MGLLSLFGFGKNRIVEAIHKGAVIIDVRPAYAFDSHGRIPHSINIPLDRIPINIERIRSMNRPVVICCAYGADCERAAQMLREKGIKDIYNGGNWESLYRKL